MCIIPPPFVAPSGDSNITCNVNDTVSSLKERAISQLAAQGKNVRLIFAGKMLDVDHNPLSEYGIADGSFVHAVVTTMRGGSNNTNSGQQSRAASTNSAPIAYRGFDRLTQLGLSIDETAALRSSFNPQINEFITSGGHQPAEGEDSTSFRFRMEEEWIAAQGARSEFSLNLPSDRAAIAALGGNGGGRGRRQGQRGGDRAGYSQMTSVNSRRLLGAGGETVDRPTNPGTMNDFFWGLAMG